MEKRQTHMRQSLKTRQEWQLKELGTEMITQGSIEATKATILALRKANNQVNNAR